MNAGHQPSPPAEPSRSSRSVPSAFHRMLQKSLPWFLRLLGTLPLFLRRELAKLLGWVASKIPSRDRTIAALQLCQYLPEHDARAIVPGVYMSLAQTLVESLNLFPMLENRALHIECPDEELIEELLSRKRPIIALTAHTGNWELMAAYMVQRGVPLSAVGRPARKRSLQTLLAEIRSDYGIRTLWRTKREGLKAITEELKNNRTVAALIDQDTRVSSVFVPFFGEPARTPSGLIALGKKFNASFVTAFNVRIAPSRYRVRVQEISDSLSIEQIATEFNRRLEETIREYPEQWVWFHKRWRSKVDRGTLSSSDYIAELKK